MLKKQRFQIQSQEPALKEIMIFKKMSDTIIV